VIRVLTFGRYADDNFGGIERYVFELALALQGEVEFTNIVARRGPAPDVALPAHTIYTSPVGHLAGAPVCPTMPLQALRRHRVQPFDVVHVQFPADPMAHVATVALPRSVRRVITWHSDIVRQRTSMRFYRPFVKRLVQSGDAIITPTPLHYTASQELPQWIPQERTRVVPYGIDYARFHKCPPQADEIRRRHGGRFLIFALGRHVYYKGLEYLVRAMRDLPDAQAVIGGKGPLTPQLESLARELGVAERVDFLGRIPDDELPAYYYACDVFCMPSVERAEAFGIVQLEAMACGKPVVCCRLGNGVNWVNLDGVTGLSVATRDAPALARALQTLSKDTELRIRLGSQGRERALRDFSTQAMARGTLEAYRAALSAPRR
jgi:glycosyltransferase involved in cell wall biosynthesis